jgi:osomolarity two-component system phosphorelay intermediate protein YPD1
MEMDDDAERSFTRSILDEFFEQVEQTLPKFKELMDKKDYDAVGKLGHFIKGSSAGVGAASLRDICEEIQTWSKKSSDPHSYLEEHITLLYRAVPVVKKALYKRLDEAPPPNL